ncbi:hypothetical protein HK103_007665 [Boothiomyces macroporosus]|uniref:Uncharacterized protein n=1 Tax=Boothiomyces macroporosus TaxID=261099 RepID=A0AAD5Y3T4_9FUNG|nr:hypothetical protein HK103_007665 [Boothiomyces macroporosus]
MTKKKGKKSPYYAGSISNYTPLSHLNLGAINTSPSNSPPTPIAVGGTSPMANDMNRYSYLSQNPQYHPPTDISDKNRASLLLQNHSPSMSITGMQNNFSYSAVLTDPAYNKANGTPDSQFTSLVTLQSPSEPNAARLPEAQLPIIAQVPEVKHSLDIQPPKLSVPESMNTAKRAASVELEDMQPPTITNFESIRKDF